MRVGVVVGMLVFSWVSQSWAEPLMYYSGTLVDGCSVPVQSEGVLVRLSLWDHGTDGVERCGHVGDGVPVELVAGRFRAALPEACNDAVRAYSDLWVEVTVITGAPGADAITFPRQALGAGAGAVRGGLNWVVTTDSAVAAEENTGYVLSATEQRSVVTLGESCVVGSTIRLVGAGQQPWLLLHPDTVVVVTPGFDTEVGSEGQYPTMGAVFATDARAHATLECVRTGTEDAAAMWVMTNVSDALEKSAVRTVFAMNANNVTSDAELAKRFDVNIEPPSYWVYTNPTPPTWLGKTNAIMLERNNNTSQKYAEIEPHMVDSEPDFSDDFEVVFAGELGQTTITDTQIRFYWGDGSVYIQLDASGSSHKLQFYNGTAMAHTWAIAKSTGVRVRAQFSGGKYRIKYWTESQIEPTDWETGNTPVAWSPPTPDRMGIRFNDYGNPYFADVLIRRIGGFSNTLLGDDFPVEAEVFAAP